MIEDLKSLLEQKREARSVFWMPLLFIKDAAWHIRDRVKNLRMRRDDARENLKLSGYALNEYSVTGLALWGYSYFQSSLDERGHIRLARDIKRIKIDVGLSHNAPNSLLWLDSSNDLIVYGFEPHPESMRKLTITPKIRSYIEKNRLRLYQVALDQGDPGIAPFFMTQDDPGTSSLYSPTRLGVKKTIRVPTVKLSDFLRLLPWETIPYIEQIKIDTQGNDLRVLQGAGKYLSERIVYVTVEVSTNGHYEYSQTEDELDAFMQNQGFDFVLGSKKGDDKTYVNRKFKELAVKINYSTQ